MVAAGVVAAVRAAMNQSMYESGENYLETILILKNTKGEVRSIDIARELGFSKPSVSRAVGILKDQGYITMGSGGHIELTEKGRKEAEEIYERHRVLTEFLMRTAHVSAETAEKDACRIEHIISSETFEGIKQFLEK